MPDSVSNMMVEDFGGCVTKCFVSVFVNICHFAPTNWLIIPEFISTVVSVLGYYQRWVLFNQF